MSQILPPLFIVIAGAALVVAVFAFWQSLRLMLTAAPDPGAVAQGSDARLQLVDEKATLLKALKEIQFERDLGKISEHDFEALNVRYRKRAKQVLRTLDAQLGTHRADAEALVRAALAPGAQSVGAPGAQSAGARSESRSPLACGKCETVNDDDAAFCKKCGQAMAGGEA